MSERPAKMPRIEGRVSARSLLQDVEAAQRQLFAALNDTAKLFLVRPLRRVARHTHSDSESESDDDSAHDREFLIEDFALLYRLVAWILTPEEFREEIEKRWRQTQTPLRGFFPLPQSTKLGKGKYTKMNRESHPNVRQLELKAWNSDYEDLTPTRVKTLLKSAIMDFFPLPASQIISRQMIGKILETRGERDISAKETIGEIKWQLFSDFDAPIVALVDAIRSFMEYKSVNDVCPAIDFYYLRDSGNAVKTHDDWDVDHNPDVVWERGQRFIVPVIQGQRPDLKFDPMNRLAHRSGSAEIPVGYALAMMTDQLKELPVEVSDDDEETTPEYTFDCGPSRAFLAELVRSFL